MTPFIHIEFGKLPFPLVERQPPNKTGTLGACDVQLTQLFSKF
jgi:hypothetical protein